MTAPLLEELLARGLELSDFRTIVTGGRRWGKTLAQQAVTEAVRGTKPDVIIFDELTTFQDERPLNGYVTNNLPKDAAICTFCDPRFPAADVSVREKRVGRFDPRNPNPAAPLAKQYELTVAGRVSRSYPAVQLAKSEAQRIHATLVARLLEEEQRHNPNFGRFA